MKRTFVWGFDKGENPNAERLRVTVRTVTFLELGQYEEKLKVVDARVDELAGGDFGAMTEQERKALPGSVITAATWMATWPILATATASVEKMVELPEEGEEGTWTPSSLADMGWDGPDEILGVTTDLLQEWVGRCREANNGIFGRYVPPQGKKSGVGLISVS